MGDLVSVNKKLGQYTVGIIIRKEDFSDGACFFRVRTANGRDMVAHPTDMELLNASR